MNAEMRRRCALTAATLVLGFIAGSQWGSSRANQELTSTQGKSAISQPEDPVVSGALPAAVANVPHLPVPQEFPTVAELSRETLEKLNISCLRPDLTIDPMLAEIAGLTPDQIGRLESEIHRFQAAWTARESTRAIAVGNEEKPGVVIPPDPDSAAQVRAAFQSQIEAIAGRDRSPLVWEALRHGMVQATGNFGEVPRMITFERNPQEAEDEPLRVRVSVFDGLDPSWNPDRDGDWSKLAAFPPTRMLSFAFKDLPVQFAPFVDQPPP